jgi:predicted nucleic acid-binding protein
MTMPAGLGRWHFWVLRAGVLRFDAGQRCHLGSCDAIDRCLCVVAQQLGDALIAATALEHNLTVLTANIKHFSAMAGLRIEAFVP